MTRYVALLFVLMVAFQPQNQSLQSSPAFLSHGTLNIALVSPTDAVLASDSLEGAPDGAVKNFCKISPLSSHSAVAVSGLFALTMVANFMASHGVPDGEPLEATIDNWVKLVGKFLNGHSYTPQPKELLPDGYIGGGIFVDIEPTGRPKYIVMAIHPVATDSGFKYVGVPAKTGVSTWPHFEFINQGIGSQRLVEYLQGKTPLGKADQDLIQKATIQKVGGKELDEIANRFMEGAINAEEIKAKRDPKYQVTIGDPVELLHFDYGRRKLEWIHSPLCDPK